MKKPENREIPKNSRQLARREQLKRQWPELGLLESAMQDDTQGSPETPQKRHTGREDHKK